MFPELFMVIKDMTKDNKHLFIVNHAKRIFETAPISFGIPKNTNKIRLKILEEIRLEINK